MLEVLVDAVEAYLAWWVRFLFGDEDDGDDWGDV